MELPVSLQVVQLAWAAALGAGLAVQYDVLRVIRRRLRRTTHLLDLFFWLTTLAACLLFALYVGQGQFRLFFFVGIGCGSSLWFLTLSRPFCRLIRQIFHILCLPFRALGKICKKFPKKRKNTFQDEKNGI